MCEWHSCRIRQYYKLRWQWCYNNSTVVTKIIGRHSSTRHILVRKIPSKNGGYFCSPAKVVAVVLTQLQITWPASFEIMLFFMNCLILSTSSHILFSQLDFVNTFLYATIWNLRISYLCKLWSRYAGMKSPLKQDSSQLPLLCYV